ncbi:MAG: hypothetical protein A2W80_07560 [Candidatus Riflebacteria bacterium GWC2_50_8]|nr:MAG: hypothetical protein A2W80_07560 [Candidatus Riflebacteria bacterium GWC2_50_8]
METSLNSTKSLIIKAALGIFAQKGFKGATVREICAAADQSVGAINYHFRDKQGLYEAVTQALLEELMLNTSPEPQNSSTMQPEARLHFLVTSFLKRFGMLFDGGDNGQRAIFMLREILNPSADFTRLFLSFQAWQKDYLLRIISDLTGCRPESPEVARSAISIIGQCFHFVFGRRLFGLLGMEASQAKEISKCAEHIVKFSLGGVKAVTGAKK